MAAAIAYGLDKKVTGERNVLISDLGGGTYDNRRRYFRGQGSCLIPTLEAKTSITVLSPSAKISNANTKRISLPTLVSSVVSAPLASVPSMPSPRPLKLRLKSILYEGIDFHTLLTRARFEELCQDLFRSMLVPVEKFLRASKIDKPSIHTIVLVGGSTRIPHVIKLVSYYFNGKEPNKSIIPDEAVAYGAAVQAAILSDDTSEKTRDPGGGVISRNDDDVTYLVQ